MDSAESIVDFCGFLRQGNHIINSTDSLVAALLIASKNIADETSFIFNKIGKLVSKLYNKFVSVEGTRLNPYSRTI